MSSAITSPEQLQESKILERPVRVDFGHLHEERTHLLELGRIARQMSGARHPSPQPFEALKVGLANLSTPTPIRSQFASIGLTSDPERDFSGPYNCMVTIDQVTVLSPHTPTKTPEEITDRLGDATWSALAYVRAYPFSAIQEFRKLDAKGEHSSLSQRDLFQTCVIDNARMPVHHRERTLAVAYAHAAINVHDYEPSLLPRDALQLVSAHANRAARSVEKFCGMGRGFQPDPMGPIDLDTKWLPLRFREAITSTTEANELGTKCARRYGLVLAEDILNRPR